MDYFTKNDTQFCYDGVGVATGFMHVIKQVISRVPNITIPPSSPFAAIQQLLKQDQVNIGALSAFTRFSNGYQSLQSLVGQLPKQLLRCFEHVFWCPTCQSEQCRFEILTHDVQTVQQTANSCFCKRCHTPLELIRPALVLIFERKVTPLQVNYYAVKHIPEQIKFYLNDIIYNLAVISTRDMTNDRFQNIIRETEEQLFFNREFKHRRELENKRVFRYYAALNNYSTLIKSIDSRYFYLKPESMDEYLNDCTYGAVESALGEAQFYYYVLENTQFQFSDQSDDIFLHEGELQVVQKDCVHVPQSEPKRDLRPFNPTSNNIHYVQRIPSMGPANNVPTGNIRTQRKPRCQPGITHHFDEQIEHEPDFQYRDADRFVDYDGQLPRVRKDIECERLRQQARDVRELLKHPKQLQAQQRQNNKVHSK